MARASFYYNFSVLYKQVEYVIKISKDSTIKDLQAEIFKSTCVTILRQYFENDILKGTYDASKTIEELGLSDDTILDLYEITSDLLVPDRDLTPRNPFNRYYVWYSNNGLSVDTIIDGLHFYEYPRLNKGLLILDEKTICDSRLFDRSNEIHKRHHLIRFLKNMHVHFNLVVWSSTSTMEGLMDKMWKMNLVTNPHVKIMCFVSKELLVAVKVPNVGVVQTKPLRKFWDIFREFDNSNTIICDSEVNKFYLNPSNGILIRPYHHQPSQSTEDKDKELSKLERYLEYIVRYPNFAQRDHADWRRRPPSYQMPRCSLM